MKILIGLVEHIGDIVACEPVPRYLKLRYPESRIFWVINKSYRELVDNNPYVDETIEVDCLTDWIKISKHANFDLVVDLHVNYRLCQHCKIPLIKERGNPLINAYEWLAYGTLLEAFTQGAGLPILKAPPNLYIQESDRLEVDKLCLPKNYCVIHRKSNNIEKDWTDERWIELSISIIRQLNIQIVEVGVYPNGEYSPLSNNSINLINKTTIHQTAEVIKRAVFFVGVDSGPSHLANAVLTPGVVLLGRMGAFNKYLPFNGLYGSDSEVVKLVRNLNGPVRELLVNEVIEAINYVYNMTRISHDELKATVNFPNNLVPKYSESSLKPYSFEITDIDLLLRSKLFDPSWYLLHYPWLELNTHTEAVEHYLSIGYKLGFETGTSFDSARYLMDNEDVNAANINPLVHFIKFGNKEKRVGVYPEQLIKSIKFDPHSQFDTSIPRVSKIVDECSDIFPHATSIESEVPSLFAFYLPQFHPIPENDWAHGAGFTEWNNVISAKPLFDGHDQPKAPGELGYYDLRAFEVMEEQIRLARGHGITGFCFYYYYFKGKRLLYKPIQNYINSDLNMPFFFLWANENWSKRWDGGDKEIIISQSHSPMDDLQFIKELIPTFKDKRYQKINGKPILCIYKAHLFPNIINSIETWRTEARKSGFNDLYLIMVDDWTSDPPQPRSLGFDASYEIPSNIVPESVLYKDIKKLDLPQDFDGRIVDYEKFAKFHLARPITEYRRFKTVMLPWDNTARYGNRAMVHINAQGDAYKLWLTAAMLDAYERNPKDERLVFVHSWNEWCEGTHLEPDKTNGRRYLEETLSAVTDVRNYIEVKISSRTSPIFDVLNRVQKIKDEIAYRLLHGSRIQMANLVRDRFSKDNLNILND